MQKITIAEAARELQLVARGHVRARTQTESYLRHGDQFAAMFLGKPLGLAPDDYRAVGTDAAVVIDTCYERLVALGEGAISPLKELTLRLAQMLVPSLALDALPDLRARLDDPSCPLVDVACSVLAAITLLGRESLSRNVAVDVVEDWLSLWKVAASCHNLQQQKHSGISILGSLDGVGRARAMEALEISQAEIRPRGTTFTEGVHEYLSAFSETAAATMALVGALPFSGELTGEEVSGLIRFLMATPDLLHLLSGVLRFAQDVTFDASEPLSTGVVALAAERAVSIPSVDARLVTADEVDAKLKAEWTVYFRASRAHIDGLLAPLTSGESTRLALTRIIDTTYFVADALTTSPHKTHARLPPGES